MGSQPELSLRTRGHRRDAAAGDGVAPQPRLWHGALELEGLEVQNGVVGGAAEEEVAWGHRGAAEEPHAPVVELVDERDEAPGAVARLQARAML